MLPSSPETRASLILRLHDARDVAAWDEFVAIYSPLVFHMARRQGLQSADADDVVQEVFTAVAGSIGRWTEQPHRSSFRGWLLKIARNIAINVLLRKPKGGVGVGGTEPDNIFSRIPLNETQLSSEFDLEFQREVYRWAAARVQELVSANTWKAFQMTHVECIPVSDAAEQLGMSVGSIYIARSRVMSRLRQLAEQFEVLE